MPVPDEDLREYCDKNYHQILPVIAEKLHQEKKNEPQGKVGTQGSPNQVHKLETEARSFQITKGEGFGKKDESESEGSAGGHWKSKLKKQKSSMEDDLSQPWPLKWNGGQCQLGAICSILHLPEMPRKSASKIWWKSTALSKEGGNLKKRQTAGNINDATMAKDSEEKDHSNFFLGINNFFPNPSGRRWTKGPMIIEAEMGGHCVHRIYVD
uniref:Reverse transcriptase domain-containing protein n=1 Tax=Tanacetum cinerariifolium TaxID=118510 RepID=A0A6L2JC91_TANCI|nr:reverse transcriptase domain-containing protein [Tanacetum cinerariifolium]